MEVLIATTESVLLELERTLWRTGASDDYHRCAGAWSLNHEVCEAVTQGSALKHWLLILPSTRGADEVLFWREREHGGGSVNVPVTKKAFLEGMATILTAVAGILMLFSMTLVSEDESNANQALAEWHSIIIRNYGPESLELERTLWHTGASDDYHRCAGAWSLNHEVCEAVTQGSASPNRFEGDVRDQAGKESFQYKAHLLSV